MDNKQLAEKIITLVAGHENIIGLTHCITRLRFNLKDSSLVKTNELKEIEGVMGIIDQGGQFQIVLGKRVSDVYKVISGTVEQSRGKDNNEDNRNIVTSEKKVWERITVAISAIFTPIIGVLAACGMLKGLLAISLVTGIVVESSSSYKILAVIADVIFYFFPIFVAVSASKYFGLNQYIGIALACILIHPSIIDMAGNKDISFFLVPLKIMNYSTTFFPAIIAVWMASFINRGFEKLIHSSVSYFLCPMMTLVVAAPITFAIIGPSIMEVSQWISTATLSVYSFSPVLAALALGGTWILIVMFGLHWAFIPIFINNMTTLGYDPIMGLLAANQFAIAGGVFAYGLATLNIKQKTLAYSTSVTCLFGVSEPALYGILVPNRNLLIRVILASSIAAAVGGVCLSKVYVFSAQGLFSVIAALNPKANTFDLGFYGYIGQMIAGFIISFAIVYFSKSTKTNVDNKTTAYN